MCGQRGPKKGLTQEVLTLPLVSGVVAHRHGAGKDTQSRINATLRAVVEDARAE
jgi:uncharacterized protein (DUF4415 family)